MKLNYAVVGFCLLVGTLSAMDSDLERYLADDGHDEPIDEQTLLYTVLVQKYPHKILHEYNAMIARDGISREPHDGISSESEDCLRAKLQALPAERQQKLFRMVARHTKKDTKRREWKKTMPKKKDRIVQEKNS